MTKLYWEDFQPGEAKTIGSIQISRAQIIAFATAYDPQPFHLDEELAKGTFLGKLCASGWQVVTLFSTAIYAGYEKDTALVGHPTIDECRWMKPVFPDDELRCVCACLETKSESDEVGACRFHWKFFDQAGEQKTDIVGWSRIKKRGKA